MAPTLAFWETALLGYLEMLRAGPRGLSPEKRKLFKALGQKPFRAQDPEVLAQVLRSHAGMTPVRARVLALVALGRPLEEIRCAVPNAGRSRRVRDTGSMIDQWRELRAEGRKAEEVDAVVGHAVGLSARSIRALRSKLK